MDKVSVTSPININSASVEDLKRLPGVGTVRANAIVVYRRQNGDIESPRQLSAVPGMKAIMPAISPYITYERSLAPPEPRKRDWLHGGLFSLVGICTLFYIYVVVKGGVIKSDMNGFFSWLNFTVIGLCAFTTLFCFFFSVSCLTTNLVRMKRFAYIGGRLLFCIILAFIIGALGLVVTAGYYFRHPSFILGDPVFIGTIAIFLIAGIFCVPLIIRVYHEDLAEGRLSWIFQPSPYKTIGFTLLFESMFALLLPSGIHDFPKWYAPPLFLFAVLLVLNMVLALHQKRSIFETPLKSDPIPDENKIGEVLREFFEAIPLEENREIVAQYFYKNRTKRQRKPIEKVFFGLLVTFIFFIVQSVSQKLIQDFQGVNFPVPMHATHKTQDCSDASQKNG
jgi:competence ComEA-like helix-hairpin-helix protein